MRQSRFAFRLTAATALAAMGLASLVPAFAQVPPPPPGSAPLTTDPPGRVGRVARLAGTVSFHTVDEDHWEPATANYPVTSGNAFWTQPSSSVDLGVSSTRITLDQTSQFTVDTLDDQALTATVGQGRIYLRVRDLAQGETATLRTPRGTVSVSQPGRYEIVVGDTQAPTLVTVDEGAVQVTGPGVSLAVAAHQTGQISGTDAFIGVVVAEVPDSFLSAQIAREQPVRETGPTAPPPAVLQMTGYDAVADTGDWQEAPDYGRVWYPPVDRDWVPYRHGHWSWVAPWGWTWVDDASWGFAPFHYGRWVQISDRWAWTPVERGVAIEDRPCYSPALVAFVGLGAGVAVGAGIGAAIGWIPLGPREVYRPPYRVSNNYLQRVNITNVRNVTSINNTNIVNNNERFINRGGATVVPGTAMQRSQPVAALARPQAQLQNAAFQPVERPGFQPSLATRGVTPAVARSLNLQPQPGVPAVRPQAAPGPAFRARPVTGEAIAPGANPTVPAGRPPEPGVRPAGPAAPLAVPGAPGAPGGPGRPAAGPGAPGPAIAPRAPEAGRAVGAPEINAARPGAGPGSPARPGQSPGAPGPAIAPRAQEPGRPGAAPDINAPRPVPQGEPARPAVPPGAVEPNAAPRPVPQAAPRPDAVAPRPNPEPQVRAAPVPQPQPRAAPAPTPQPRVAPAPTPQPQPHVAPAPAPQPQPRAAPPPQPRPAPPAPRVEPAPRPAPPPAPRPAPPPAPRPEPPRPAPAPRAEPARPEPARAPAPHKECPPGRAAC